MAQINFDARSIPPADAFDPIPPGWYLAKIVESENKITKDQTGSFLALTFQLIDGQYKGRKVFTNLNLQNANPVAVEIAQKNMSAICHATGVIQVMDSNELHGIPLQIKLTVRKDPSGQYADQNEVKGYKPVEKGQGAAPMTPPVATGAPFAATANPPFAAVAAPAAPATPPWGGATTTAAAPVAPPVAAPPPVVAAPPPVVAAPPATPVYKIGDVANGHVLTAQGWVPQPPAPPVAAPPAPPAAPPPPPGVPTEGGSAVPPWARAPGT